MQLPRPGPSGSERPAVRAGDGARYDPTPSTDDVTGKFLTDDGIARARTAPADGTLHPIGGVVGLDHGPRSRPPKSWRKGRE